MPKQRLIWEVQVSKQDALQLETQCEAMREIYNTVLRKAFATFQQIYQNARWRAASAKIRFCFFNDVTRREGANLSALYATTNAIEKENGWAIETFLPHAQKVNLRFGGIVPEATVYELTQRAFTRFNNLRTVEASRIPLLSFDHPVAIVSPHNTGLVTLQENKVHWNDPAAPKTLRVLGFCPSQVRHTQQIRFFAKRLQHTQHFFLLLEGTQEGSCPQACVCVRPPPAQDWLFLEK